MSTRILLMACLCVSVSACWDFVEPELPVEAGVSVLQVSALLEDNGRVQISGLLAPGIDEDGFRRRILNDTLGVFDIRFPPTGSRSSGSREYVRIDTIGSDAFTRPFTVEPPQLANVTAPPVVQWYGARKLDPDTITIARGSDLVLRLDMAAGTSTPPPGTYFWSLNLSGAGENFQLGGTGAPPAELRVPAVFLPDSSGEVRATLLSTQASVIRAPNFRGNYTFTVRSTWLILVQ
jgi:hypothetical protein